MKIKITKDGPYIVSGCVPLFEKAIIFNGNIHELKNGRILPQKAHYLLCRCGKTKTPPFCDGSHINCFDGKETASRELYIDRSQLYSGKEIDMYDDNRCALARFCHRNNTNAWELINDEKNKEEAIKSIVECPSGRLTAKDKDGNAIEQIYEPSIEIIYDTNEGVNSGIAVKGNITIESEDGHIYEQRNRVMLCRCGKSKNKPFCDASHTNAVDSKD